MAPADAAACAWIIAIAIRAAWTAAEAILIGLIYAFSPGTKRPHLSEGAMEQTA